MRYTIASRPVRESAVGAALAIGIFAYGLPAPAAAADLAQEATVPQSVATVTMTGRRFSPQTITVRAGETVVWQNASSSTHTVTAESVPPGAALFDSGNVGRRGQFSHTFTVAGEYHYYCRPHRRIGMVGTVVVEP
jgi:plastocyanin